MQFRPPVRVDVPAVGDVVGFLQHLALAGEAVEADERRIGAEHAPVERRAENALADVVVEVLETAVAGAQSRQFGVPVQGQRAEGETDDDQPERRREQE